MTDLFSILKQVRPEADYAGSQNFIEDGLLDSFDLVTLVSELDKAHGISIEGTDIVPENFQNAAAILELLRKYGVTA